MASDMKFELVNVKVYPNLSEETTCFIGELMLNQVVVATCRNDGRGGITDVYFDDWSVKCKVAEYCEANPIAHILNDKTYTFNTIDALVDELLYKLMRKNEKL